MKLKSYFAATMEAALNLARQELGADAMLVDSRKANPASRHLGEYEVVCAVFPPPAPAPRESPAGPASGEPRVPNLDRLSQEVSDLKRSMERMALTIARSSDGFHNLRSQPELAEGFACLTASGVESALAHDILSAVAGRADRAQGIPALMVLEIERILATESRLGRPGSTRAIVALAGPPGAGKTSCLVKLAARYGLQTRRPTQILTLDTQRVAAAEQLRSYSAILGMGFQVVETAASLAQALEEHRHKDLILIDTPGFGGKDLPDAEEIAHFLSTHRDIDTHLVLPASLSTANLKRLATAYEIFRPGKLLFTRLDETATLGALLNVAVFTGKPLSFLSSGQQIPEDLEPANRAELAKAILRHEFLEDILKQAEAAA